MSLHEATFTLSREENMSTDNIELRTAKQVRQKIGHVSDVTLWRRINNPELNFPQPIKILGRLYFQAAEIDAWITEQARKAQVEAQAKIAERTESENPELIRARTERQPKVIEADAPQLDKGA